MSLVLVLRRKFLKVGVILLIFVPFWKNIILFIWRVILTESGLKPDHLYPLVINHSFGIRFCVVIIYQGVLVIVRMDCI